ncbi:MAG: CpaF family protein, partial [Chloroflexi bacterium]
MVSTRVVETVHDNGRSQEAVLPANLVRVRNWLVEQIIARLDPAVTWQRTPEATRQVFQHFQRLYQQAGLTLSEEMRKRLFEAVADEVLGYGPIEPFLQDPTVSEVMVNGPHLVYVERNGKLEETGVRFDDDEHVIRIAQRIVKPLGRPLDRAHPRVDARLPDGSRVNIIIPPAALPGPVITIRK